MTAEPKIEYIWHFYLPSVPLVHWPFPYFPYFLSFFLGFPAPVPSLEKATFYPRWCEDLKTRVLSLLGERRADDFKNGSF